ncbi:16S rRNA (uracil(1498)-N(3))-methyltransferase [Cytophagales bacterium LB-30]|uniref:Ribosomal RNA small subunit methyltransferase E n=1 Tax=Shiella aurantiaca TaxID=3058365 RepID=A0ABT8F230_9BACT|nr:16S rRNA (uracil(1498)-N(3))-methyltransferase [Shiella aurantiaca]MDN4164306.1 16S rRNA (uracil(1498)-N(3))-methyltransferase [Shiella aurantiaca]
MQLFYLPDIAQATLSEAESLHCVKVLRHQTGDTLHVTDGAGHLYQAQILEAKAKACKLHNFQLVREEEPKGFHIHLAIAPTKNIERMEWFVEKTIELGIDQITFLKCQNSERKGINLERMEKKAVGAMKQSLHLRLPQLSEEIPFSTFLKQAEAEQKFIAYVDENHTKHLKNCLKENQRYLVLIGPEGDFTSEEIQYALASGFMPISLGNSRLRTETAGLAACMMCQWVNE